jgi:hypothetical protein
VTGTGTGDLASVSSYQRILSQTEVDHLQCHTGVWGIQHCLMLRQSSHGVLALICGVRRPHFRLFVDLGTAGLSDSDPRPSMSVHCVFPIDSNHLANAPISAISIVAICAVEALVSKIDRLRPWRSRHRPIQKQFTFTPALPTLPCHSDQGRARRFEKVLRPFRDMSQKYREPDHAHYSLSNA